MCLNGRRFTNLRDNFGLNQVLALILLTASSLLQHFLFLFLFLFLLSILCEKLAFDFVSLSLPLCFMFYFIENIVANHAKQEEEELAKTKSSWR